MTIAQKIVRTTLRIPLDIHEALTARANETGDSINTVIIEALAAALFPPLPQTAPLGFSPVEGGDPAALCGWCSSALGGGAWVVAGSTTIVCDDCKAAPPAPPAAPISVPAPLFRRRARRRGAT